MAKTKESDNTGPGHYKVPGTEITIYFDVTPTGGLEKVDKEAPPQEESN